MNLDFAQLEDTDCIPGIRPMVEKIRSLDWFSLISFMDHFSRPRFQRLHLKREKVK